MSAIAAVIGFIGLGIAYFQWRTAHQRVVMDLFEKRVTVVQEIEDSLRDAVNTTGEDLNAAFWRFVLAERRARFLFGADVHTALDGLRSEFAALKSFDPTNPRHGDAMERVSNFLLAESTPLFTRYVRLDQAMPSFWWTH